MIKFIFYCLLISYSTFVHAEKGYTLIGEGILSFYFWDVYKVSYLKDKKSSDELIKITYLRDVKREHSQQGWDESLGEVEGIKDQLSWLKSNAIDVKEGDILSIYKVNGGDVIIKKNNKIISRKENDKKLFSIVHSPWIGKHSVDEELKDKLLKGR